MDAYRCPQSFSGFRKWVAALLINAKSRYLIAARTLLRNTGFEGPQLSGVWNAWNDLQHYAAGDTGKRPPVDFDTFDAWWNDVGRDHIHDILISAHPGCECPPEYLAEIQSVLPRSVYHACGLTDWGMEVRRFQSMSKSELRAYCDTLEGREFLPKRATKYRMIEFISHGTASQYNASGMRKR